MSKVKWYFNRLISMSIPEIVWRIQQNKLQKVEHRDIYNLQMPVYKIPVQNGIKNRRIDINRLCIEWENSNYTLFEKLDIFNKYNYYEYKKKWNSGFQTNNFWPNEEFSFSIKIGQREDVGDIRTNWELNRHYQFVGLSKNYYLTKEKKYLDELIDLFYSWNNSNLFLHGVQWTSAMEVAIRIVSWVYMYAFLYKAQCQNYEFLQDIENGIKVMAQFVLLHQSKYSSANNHLIVEMLGVGIAGIIFDYRNWVNTSIKILTEELIRQNFSDGVNKEMSIHYQAFILEAYGILFLQLRKNRIEIPNTWYTILDKLSIFVADCCGDYNETIEFGDNDEGKILDFVGKVDNYYHYVLILLGIVLGKRYINKTICENIFWLINSEEIFLYENRECYVPPIVSHYKQGGFTILRSKDRKVLLGIDHAELGFGTIAAHGHLDALSVQAFYQGRAILLDSGTFNYHVPKKVRDEIRSSRSHNTLYIKGVNQAEILGPFLFGKRYIINKVELTATENKVVVIGEIQYGGIKHRRKFVFDFQKTLVVEDFVNKDCDCYQCWIIQNDSKIENNKSGLSNDYIYISNKGIINYINYSNMYNHYDNAICYSIPLINNKIETIIKIR